MSEEGAETDMEAYELIEAYRPYLRHFNRKEYPDYFARYRSAAEPFFDALEPEAAEMAASALLDKLEGDWAARRWGTREMAREDDKQLVALFLLPAALAHGSQAAAVFAEALVRQWNERWPKSGLLAGSFEEIQAGFPRGFHIGGITFSLPTRREK